MTSGRLDRVPLPPDVFAVVMATGIISVAASERHYPRIAAALGVAAGVAFGLLALGVVVRLAIPGRVVAQVRRPDVALRMFTFVAACTVLGAVADQHPGAVWLLGALGSAGWLVLVPLAAVDVWSRRPGDLRDHAHGAWLLPSVATAGLAITAEDLAVHSGSRALVVVGAVAWLLGVVTYLAVTWLIAWRALAAPLRPDEVTPDSWILMGALAITALAGDHLLTAMHALSWATALAGWTRGLTLAAWVGASVWIPLLAYAEVWRADHLPGSLHYRGVWWSAVFPLGMYSAASAATASALTLPALATISLVFFWNALTVWAMVALGLAHTAVARRDRRIGR